MAINTGKIQTVSTVRDLLREARSFSASTLPTIITRMGLSLDAENAIRAYYNIKTFRRTVETLLAQADLDAVFNRETGEASGVRADLTALDASIASFLTLIESNQSAIFATMTLGANSAQYGNLTTGQRNAIVTSLNAIAAHFSG